MPEGVLSDTTRTALGVCEDRRWIWAVRPKRNEKTPSSKPEAASPKGAGGEWLDDRRKFRSQLLTIWTDEKQRWSRRLEKRRAEERRSEKRKSQKKEDAGARKGRKVTKHRVFQWFVAPEGRKVDSLKRRVRSHLARWEMNNCTPLWREAHFEVKMCKTRFGALLEVEMSKKCMPLWREAHFQVKMHKTHHSRTTFGSSDSDVEKVHAVVARAHFEVKMLKAQGVRTTFGRSDVVSRGRRKGLCTLSKVRKMWGFCSIFNCNHHYATLHRTTLQYTTPSLHLHYAFTTPSLHSTTLHYTTLHYTPLHSTILHYATLNYIHLRSITFNYTTLHYATLHYTTFHYTTLHYTTLHYSTVQLHYTTQHYTTFH